MRPSESTAAPDVTIVVPTIGRSCLGRLLEALLPQLDPSIEVIVVDDRSSAETYLTSGVEVGERVQFLTSGGRGPAAARNAGWRQATSEWIAFLDDDVMVDEDWFERLAVDLSDAAPEVAAVQGRLSVPTTEDESLSDIERNVKHLETSIWITADMAVRRDMLTRIGGFDERFRRAYREDTDLGMRVLQAGGSIEMGSRHVSHPVRPTSLTACLGAQRGNADDALMRRLHGPHWRELGHSPRGRFPFHVATVLAAGAALGAAGRSKRRLFAVFALLWVGLWGDFTTRRITKGRDSVSDRLVIAGTSALIPPLAIWWRIVGTLRHRGQQPLRSRGPVRAVLFDRDGTLVHDVPYNGDPDLVCLVDGAVESIERLRRAGVLVGMVTNQSGVARGLIDETQVGLVNRRIAEMVGGFDDVQICLHGPGDSCACRKPSPGMIIESARRLGVPVESCVVIGDIGSDVQAGLNAGARTVLVPTAATRREEIDCAPLVHPTLASAVDHVLRDAELLGGGR